MQFSLKPYIPPDLTLPIFQDAPNAALSPAPVDGCAPEGYHATSIFPEYFKVDGRWLLAEKSRMDCVAVYENGHYNHLDTINRVRFHGGIPPLLKKRVSPAALCKRLLRKIFPMSLPVPSGTTAR